MCQSSRGKKIFCRADRAGGAWPAFDTFSRNWIALAHCAAVIVAGHCVGVIVVVEDVGPEGVSEMSFVFE
jgi:hypothetical protein